MLQHAAGFMRVFKKYRPGLAAVSIAHLERSITFLFFSFLPQIP